MRGGGNGDGTGYNGAGGKFWWWDGEGGVVLLWWVGVGRRQGSFFMP